MDKSGKRLVSDSGLHRVHYGDQDYGMATQYEQIIIQMHPTNGTVKMARTRGFCSPAVDAVLQQELIPLVHSERESTKTAVGPQGVVPIDGYQLAVRRKLDPQTDRGHVAADVVIAATVELLVAAERTAGGLVHSDCCNYS